MVWAGIMINGRTRLHVVANGTMTGQRYIDEVLLPHVRLFRGVVGDKFVFMDDNATYLNPIENVWNALGRQVAGRNYPPTNKNTLIRALTEEWDKLPQQLLDNVVQNLNPIENVWNALGRQVAGRNYPPTNKNTLIRALTEEWDKLPQQLLDNVVQNDAQSPQICKVRCCPRNLNEFLTKCIVDSLRVLKCEEQTLNCSSPSPHFRTPLCDRGTELVAGVSWIRVLVPLRTQDLIFPSPPHKDQSSKRLDDEIFGKRS
ncbi:transposable element Tc1 transposase [Trichonephila clavipes]|nr:transposable element Tc1 transposase [Trichonephila clavipes]